MGGSGHKSQELGQTHSQDGPVQMGLCHNDVGPKTRKKEQKSPKTEIVPRI